MYPKKYKGADFDKIYEVLSTLKDRKIKTNKTLIEKYTGMLENTDFEQDKFWRRAKGIYKIGHDSIRSMK